MDSPVLLALAFSAGSATFFAPCSFPLLPGYLSYFLGRTVDSAAGSDDPDGLVDRFGRPLARGAVTGGVVAAGILAVYVGLAGTAISLGARALSGIAVMELVVGGVFVVAGTAMAAGWRPSSHLVRLPERKRSWAGFFAFGALYATAAAGCTAPLFVAVVLKGLSAGPVHGVGIAVAYAAGMGAVMVTLTGLAAVGGTSVVSRLAGRAARIQRVAGGLLALSGVAQVYYYVYGFPEAVAL
ncbi:MAG: cytochrome c biogenesis CcdA family protein [Halolamina sp.]